jgi:hypothetical protein
VLRPARRRIEAQVVRVLDGLQEARRGGDHRGVVRAELDGRDPDLHIQPLHGCAQLRVRRHAASDGQPPEALALQRRTRALDESLDDRALIRGGKVRGA